MQHGWPASRVPHATTSHPLPNQSTSGAALLQDLSSQLDSARHTQAELEAALHEQQAQAEQQQAAQLALAEEKQGLEASLSSAEEQLQQMQAQAGESSCPCLPSDVAPDWRHTLHELKCTLQGSHCPLQYRYRLFCAKTAG